MAEQEPMLPVIRPDLEFFPAPHEENGEPFWMVRDPVHSRYSRLNWAQMKLVEQMREPHTLDELHKLVTEKTPLHFSRSDLEQAVKDLIQNELTVATLNQHPETLLIARKRKKVHPLRWLLHHYLFFRIPILRPDNFLERSLSAVSVLVSPMALMFYVLAGLFGLYFVTQQFDTFINTFPRFYTLSGAFAYGLTIICVKAIHEFSHAYVAKAMGNRVAAMGITMIVLWPVPYCDVTDSWRMDSRRQRLLISSAGVLSELVVGALALLGWGLFPEDSLGRSICFMLSTVAVLGTVLVNLNPGMRFDGYYALGDLLGIDNLRPRAFNIARWWYRKILFGSKAACPETLSKRRFVLMISFAIYSYLYSLSVYIGIAIFVYYAFTRTLGMLLFSIEIYSFVLQPVFRELQRLFQGRSHFFRIRHSVVCASIITLLFLWLVIPLPRRESFPAITEPVQEQLLYANHEGELADVSLVRGGIVKKGQLLFRVSSKSLSSSLRIAEQQVRLAQAQLNLSNSLENESRAFLREKQEDYRRAQARKRSLEKQISQNRVFALFDGKVHEWGDTLRDGVDVARQERLGSIAIEKSPIIIAYVPEKSIAGVFQGQKVRFVSKAGSCSINGKISKVYPQRTIYLQHPGLSFLYGGPLLVNRDGGNIRLLDSYYQIEIKIDDADHISCVRLGQPGHIWLYSAGRSYFVEFVRHVQHVLMREFSF